MRDLTGGTTTQLGRASFRTSLMVSADGKHVVDEDLCGTTCPSIPPAQRIQVYDWQGVTYPHVPDGGLVGTSQSEDGRLVLHFGAGGLAEFDRVTGTDQVLACCSGANTTMSADGRVVVFSSARADLVPNDTNGVSDWFALDAHNGAVRRVDVSAFGTQSDSADVNQNTAFASVNRNGRYAGFASTATNLVPNDTDGFLDSFVADAASPMPAAITPSTLKRGSRHASLLLDGGFLLDDASYDLGPGVTVESVTHQSNGSQTLVVSVAADAPSGTRDVAVTDPGALSAARGVCGGCLAIR